MLFCVASDTDWIKAGVRAVTTRALLDNGLIERGHLSLSAEGRAIFNVLVRPPVNEQDRACQRLIQHLAEERRPQAALHLGRVGRLLDQKCILLTRKTANPVIANAAIAAPRIIERLSAGFASRAFWAAPTPIQK
jgi:hypothetical protein